MVGNIAERYGVGASQVAAWNNLYRYRIRVGQKLRIYTTPAKAAQAANYRPEPRPTTTTSSNPATSGTGTYHTVRRGDTLWGMARKYGISVEQIRRLNPSLDASDLKIGQNVRVR